MNSCPSGLRLFQEEPGRARGVEHNILGNKQSSRHALSQIRFQPLQFFRIENNSRNSSCAVVILLAADLQHLVLGGRYPNGSARFVFHVRRQAGTQFLPEPLRVTRQSKLRFGIIHHHNVSHASRRRTAAGHISVNDRAAQALPHTLMRTGCTDDASAHDHDVVGCSAQARMPMQNGSSESNSSSASALTNAEPLMLGHTCPSRTRTLPSKMLPTILSCFQT